MTILGIETATAVCGVALLRDGRLLGERWIEKQYAHAETLFGFLDDVMENAGVLLRDAEGIAVSIGPGSFTGLRIGLSVVKGLHMATHIPVVAVPTLEALARRGEDEGRLANAGSILTVLDARRNEVYWQLFTLTSAGVAPLRDVTDGPVEGIVDALPEGVVALTGEARVHVATSLQQAGVAASRIAVLSGPSARCSAVTVARVGAELQQAGAVADVSALEPRYIKEFFLRTPE
jgi:tRNA threonylcarbamoyladenosine biosynthesis protein TsaB